MFVLALRLDAPCGHGPTAPGREAAPRSSRGNNTGVWYRSTNMSSAAAQRPPGRHPPIAEVLEDLELIRAHALRLPNVQEREAADTPRRLLAVCAPHHQHQRETHEQDGTQGQQGGVSSHGAPSFLSVRTVRLSHEANPSHPTGRVGPRLLA